MAALASALVSWQPGSAKAQNTSWKAQKAEVANSLHHRPLDRLNLDSPNILKGGKHLPALRTKPQPSLGAKALHEREVTVSRQLRQIDEKFLAGEPEQVETPESSRPMALAIDRQNPKPQPSGGVLTVIGWVAFGLGAAGSGFTGVWFALADGLHSNSRDTSLALLITSGMVTVAGLGGAIVGMVQKSRYEDALEAWYEGPRETASTNTSPVHISPLLSQDIQGLSLSIGF